MCCSTTRPHLASGHSCSLALFPFISTGLAQENLSVDRAHWLLNCIVSYCVLFGCCCLYFLTDASRLDGCLMWEGQLLLLLVCVKSISQLKNLCQPQTLKQTDPIPYLELKPGGDPFGGAPKQWHCYAAKQTSYIPKQPLLLLAAQRGFILTSSVSDGEYYFSF